MLFLRLAILGAMFAAGFYFYPYLPQKLPVHWNIFGQIDGYMGKPQAVWFMPVFASVLFILFNYLPRLDPKHHNYRFFLPQWEAIQTGLIVFFAYLQFITFYASLFPRINILPLMFIGIGGLFLLLGRVLGHIRQNYFIGVKLPWTLSSVDNWNRTHRLTGQVFTLVGIFTLFAPLFHFSPVLIFSLIILSAIIPIFYSFWLFRTSK